jgi:hypothetical protein
VGLDLGVISPAPFSIMVIVTLVASPLPVLPVLDASVSEPATPENENALGTYQTRQAFSRTMGCPLLQAKAF